MKSDADKPGQIIQFKKAFADLTGNTPLSWQQRLYDDHFAKEGAPLPAIIDLPTGLGKTMVMAIWLIARANHPTQIPTRLIYVVDRRTVVDQATDLAEDFGYLLSANPAREFPHIANGKPKLAERWQNLGELRARLGQPLTVSTLRGQLADNREWSRDPSRPAIVIGTVDLIGSALLFSGYRCSFKTRPLHAGLLGQDSLLLLDEAHLSKPFSKLITSISSQQSGDGSPMKVIQMSATTPGDDGSRFTLHESDLAPEVPDRGGHTIRNPIVERFNAKKTLTLTTTDGVPDAIADAAMQLAESQVGSRIVIFVKSPKDVVLRGYFKTEEVFLA